MARTAIHLKTQLFELLCHDEADGIGDAEPYLWPVFFKIDGDSFAVDAVGLIGFPTIIATNGSHGNLGNTDVEEGDRILIPEALGTQTTLLKPIPVNDPSHRIVLGDDLPGIAGVVAVVMEQDGWPDDIATIGYDALVEAVRLGVAKAAATFQHNSSVPTQEEIDEQIALIKAMAAKMVRGAILEHMSGGQIAKFGTVGNNDDRIGTETWTVTQDDFTQANFKTFVRRWEDDETDGNGDWELTVVFTNLDGRVVAPDQCPGIAAQIQSLTEELSATGDLATQKAIRQAISLLRQRARQLGCPTA